MLSACCVVNLLSSVVVVVVVVVNVALEFRSDVLAPSDDDDSCDEVCS